MYVLILQCNRGIDDIKLFKSIDNIKVYLDGLEDEYTLTDEYLSYGRHEDQVYDVVTDFGGLYGSVYKLDPQ